MSDSTDLARPLLEAATTDVLAATFRRGYRHVTTFGAHQQPRDMAEALAATLRAEGRRVKLLLRPGGAIGVYATFAARRPSGHGASKRAHR